MTFQNNMPDHDHPGTPAVEAAAWKSAEGSPSALDDVYAAMRARLHQPLQTTDEVRDQLRSLLWLCAEAVERQGRSGMVKGAVGLALVSPRPWMGLGRGRTEALSRTRRDHIGTWPGPGLDVVPMVALMGAGRDPIEAPGGTSCAAGLVRASVGAPMGPAVASRRSSDGGPAAEVIAAAICCVRSRSGGGEGRWHRIGSCMVPIADRRQAVVPPAGPRTFRSEAQECNYGAKYTLESTHSSVSFSWCGPARDDSRDEGLVSS